MSAKMIISIFGKYELVYREDDSVRDDEHATHRCHCTFVTAPGYESKDLRSVLWMWHDTQWRTAIGLPVWLESMLDEEDFSEPMEHRYARL